MLPQRVIFVRLRGPFFFHQIWTTPPEKWKWIFWLLMFQDGWLSTVGLPAESAHCWHPEAAWVGASSRELCCIPAAYKQLTQANKFTTDFKIDTEVYIHYGLRPLVSQVPLQALTVEDDPWSCKVRPIHVRSQGLCRSRKWGSARTQKITLQSGIETKQLWAKRIKHDWEWNLSLWMLPYSLKWG